MTVLGLVLIPLWVLQINDAINLPLAMPGLFWHQHEMLFGFLSAAIAGRLLLAFGADAPERLVQVVNLAFLPLVMLDAGWRIWAAPGPTERLAENLP
jgi:uncharacterized protein involved in response to NO